MDFINKKEELADMIEEYMNDLDEAKLINYINNLLNDEDFKSRDLFRNIFAELNKYLPELSHKELKQRVLMIRGYIE